MHQFGSRSSNGGQSRSSPGFTLHEMLVSLLISSSLALGGISMWSMLQENELTVATNELVTHLALARSEAVTRPGRVRVCPSADQANCSKPDADYTFWQHGWLVYADENGDGKPQAAEIVRVHPGVSKRLVIRTSRARRGVIYQPIGTAGGSTITFAVCSARDSARGRYVTVSNSGRARVSRTTTSAVKCG